MGLDDALGFAFLILPLGGGVIAIGLVPILRQRTLRTRGVRTQGDIVETKQGWNGTAYRVSFSVDGARYVRLINAFFYLPSDPDLANGKLSVMYDPDNPNIVMTPALAYSSLYRAGAVGAVLLGGGFLVLLSGVIFFGWRP